MELSWMVRILLAFVMFFVVYLVLAIVRNWNGGVRQIGKAIFRTPVRILLATVALYGVVTEQMWITIIFTALLFLQVYFISREDREEIKKLKAELKEKRN